MTTSTPHAPILVVDDDRDLRSMLVDVLEASGYRVLAAEHGRHALEVLHAGPRPALILLDLMMPVMNGWQFRAEQRSDPALSDIPVVVLTAFADDHGTMKNLDVAEVVKKPVGLDSLLELIERHARPGDEP